MTTRSRPRWPCGLSRHARCSRCSADSPAPDIAVSKIYALSRAMRARSEEHTSELQSLMRNSYAVFCLKKKKQLKEQHTRKKNTTKDTSQQHTDNYIHRTYHSNRKQRL